MESRIIALSYNFSLDYPLNFQPRRFGTVAVSVEAVPKVPTLRVRKPAVCAEEANSYEMKSETRTSKTKSPRKGANLKRKK